MLTIPNSLFKVFRVVKVILQCMRCFYKESWIWRELLRLMKYLFERFFT